MSNKYICIAQCPELDYEEKEHCIRYFSLKEYNKCFGECPCGNTPIWIEIKGKTIINNVPIIRQIEQEINRIQREADENIKILTQSLQISRKQNQVCENCGGEGGSIYRTCAEADRDWHVCQKCDGTGRNNYE